MKVKSDISEVAHKSDSKLEIKTDTIINREGLKLFDNTGKLIAANHKETPKIDELGLLKNPTKPVAKTAKKVTIPKEEKLYKYNTSTKELLKIRDTLKKENAGNPIIKEIDGKIEKRRANWRGFYNKNKDKYKQWSSNWRENNPDKVKASQQRYAEKKKAEREQQAKKTVPVKSKKSTTKKSSSKKSK